MDRLEKVLVGFAIGYLVMTIFAAGYLAGLVSMGWTAGLATVF
jgi:hypothetical protein